MVDLLEEKSGDQAVAGKALAVTDETTPLDDYRRLYAAAIAVKELSPWEFMQEPDIFGVQNPENGTLGFVSVMGQMGEHFAVAVYLGPEGLYGFLDLAQQDSPPTMQQIFEVPQLQASFEDRGLLRKDEIETIKRLGLRFRGRGAWPQLRSFRPGFMPWILEPEEVRFLACVLEQLTEVAPRYEKTPDLLAPGGFGNFLVRVPCGNDAVPMWQDEIMHVELPEPLQIPMRIDGASMRKAQKLPKSETSLEIDLVALPTTIHEKGGRPFYPYALLAVDSRIGTILLGELMYVQTTLQEMWGGVPQNLVDQLTKSGFLPRSLRIRSDLLMQLLGLLAEDLGFTLARTDVLPSLDDAMASMEGFLSRAP